MAEDTTTVELEAPLPEVKDEPRKAPNTGRTPPKEGICKRCGQDKPINRLMLCYACWVITNLEDSAKSRGELWTPQMPHPAWCACSIPGKHPDRTGHAGPHGGN